MTELTLSGEKFRGTVKQVREMLRRDNTLKNDVIALAVVENQKLPVVMTKKGDVIKAIMLARKYEANEKGQRGKVLSVISGMVDGHKMPKLEEVRKMLEKEENFFDDQPIFHGIVNRVYHELREKNAKKWQENISREKAEMTIRNSEEFKKDFFIVAKEISVKYFSQDRRLSFKHLMEACWDLIRERKADLKEAGAAILDAFESEGEIVPVEEIEVEIEGRMIAQCVVQKAYNKALELHNAKIALRRTKKRAAAGPELQQAVNC